MPTVLLLSLSWRKVVVMVVVFVVRTEAEAVAAAVVVAAAARRWRRWVFSGYCCPTCPAGNHEVNVSGNADSIVDTPCGQGYQLRREGKAKQVVDTDATQMLEIPNTLTVEDGAGRKSIEGRIDFVLFSSTRCAVERWLLLGCGAVANVSREDEYLCTVGGKVVEVVQFQ